MDLDLDLAQVHLKNSQVLLGDVDLVQVQVQVQLGYRLGGIGLGLVGGLEQSQWMGTSCNSAQSPLVKSKSALAAPRFTWP